jgi:hypothetical protein
MFPNSRLKVALILLSVLTTGCLQTTNTAKKTPKDPTSSRIKVVPVGNQKFEYYSNKGGSAFFGLLGAAIEYAATKESRETGTAELEKVLVETGDPRQILASKLQDELKACFRESKRSDIVYAGDIPYGEWLAIQRSVVPNFEKLKTDTDYVLEVAIQNTAVADGVRGDKTMSGYAYAKLYKTSDASLIFTVREWNGIQQQVTFTANNPKDDPETYRKAFDVTYRYVSSNIAQKICDKNL